MCCPSPYWWILLEPPGTPRILLDVPHPQYLKCMAALVCRFPPPFIHFIPMLWGLLACVALLHTGAYYWNHLELLGFSGCAPPPVPEMYGCTGVQVPPPFIHFIPMPWAVLACVAILPTTKNYWNHLELLGFSWMCPTGVPVTPPLSYILFPCSGLCWHALPFSLLLETIGTTWNS